MTTTMPEFSRFEAESKLYDAVMLLRNPENLEPIKNRVIGDFWDPSWRRAPFEECLTFKQLASIQYDTLIKKRSLDEDKMIALARAVMRAVETPTFSTSSSSPHSAPLNPREASPAREGSISWKGSKESLNGTDVLLCEGLLSLLQSLPLDHPYARIVRRAAKEIDASAWAHLWRELENPASVPVPVAAQVLSIMSAEAPELHLHWSTALSGAGANIKTLLTAYSMAQLPVAVISELTVLFLLCMGARPVVIQGRFFAEHYSTSPLTAQSISDALYKPSMTEDEIRSTFSLPFPFFDIELLVLHLKDGEKKDGAKSAKRSKNVSKKKIPPPRKPSKRRASV